MNQRTLASDVARTNWRDLLDAVSQGSDDIVIERFGKPTAVVMGLAQYEQYRQALALLTELAQATDAAAIEELLATRVAQQRVQEYLDKPAIARSYFEFRRRVVNEGVLDE